MTNNQDSQRDMHIVERVVTAGDLSKLSPAERVQYYNATCESLGLNPLTKPFDYISLNGKLTLYAKRDCTDQLRKLHQISVSILSRERMDDVYVVTARAIDFSGRVDESIGAVSIGNLRGEQLGNALMKAETKAKRRVTLSIVGLGWLDETEIGSIPAARPMLVDETGKIEDEAEPTGEKPAEPPKAEPAEHKHALPPEPKEAPKQETTEKKPDRTSMIRRLATLVTIAAQLSGGQRYNDFHLKNHLKKHYGVEAVVDLTDEQMVAFGKALAAEVAELEAAAKTEQQEAA
jgi:hypothetical protein